MVDRRFLLPEYSAYLWAKKRADERTRTAYPCSLRVRCYICRAIPPCPEKAHK
jgi:hypothetical protein